MTEQLSEKLEEYNSFMQHLRHREMQGRSESMMREDLKLPGWIDAMLDPDSAESRRRVEQVECALSLAC